MSDMVKSPQTTQELLDFDPLAHAEELTGKSYKDDEDTMKVGFGAHLIYGDIKRQRLAEERDTHWGVHFDTFQQIMTELGFHQVLSVPFEVRAEDDSWPTTNELFEVWFNRECGGLITADTYTHADDHKVPRDERTYHHTINSAHLQFNIQFNEDANHWNLGGSSSPINYVEGELRHSRAVYLDIREGFRHNWNKIQTMGTMLTPWLAPYSSYAPGGVVLTHYGDEHQMHIEKTGKKYGGILSYEERQDMLARVNAERLPLLPEYVRECINASDSDS